MLNENDYKSYLAKSLPQSSEQLITNFSADLKTCINVLLHSSNTEDLWPDKKRVGDLNNNKFRILIVKRLGFIRILCYEHLFSKRLYLC